MITVAPCAGCGASVGCLEDSYAYTLSGDPTYPYFFLCPPPYTCKPGPGNTQPIIMNCCDHLIERTISGDMTPAMIQELLIEMFAECAIYTGECPDPPVTVPQPPPGGVNPPSPDPNPTTIYYNTPQRATVSCPDGSIFVYVLPSGIFVDTTQQRANQSALTFATLLAAQNKVCLSELLPLACSAGPSITFTITASSLEFYLRSGVVASWSIYSGTIPTGMTFSGGTTAATLSGTPTAPGDYTFTVQVSLSSGSYMRKTYYVAVLPAYTGPQILNTPPCATGLKNRSLAGLPPSGLTLSQNISGQDQLIGTPTTVQICSFRITYT